MKITKHINHRVSVKKSKKTGTYIVERYLGHNLVQAMELSEREAKTLNSLLSSAINGSGKKSRVRPF